MSDRHSLIRQYIPLVKSVASGMARRLPAHVSKDDLIGAGTIGLIDAVDKFDRSRAQSFRKYAEIRIKGAILDELRAMDHVSRSVRRQATELDRITRDLVAVRGQDVTAEEVASELGLELEEYHAHLEKLKPVFLVSLQDLTGGDDERDGLQVLEDPNAADPQEQLHLKRLHELVASAIEELADKPRTVVALYYYDDMTLKEIGKILGVTESRISQLLSQATKTLQKRVRFVLSQELTSANPFE
ncbi:MAG: FliA/WhiG family RNA polymerase sigma factor [Myxococcota bacterium]|nr:FliA/WhiG family RNA polymerase sigma factor [Myxococcota bacterium]